ncbi:MAG: DegV family EDD domain-containing protein, partial [Bacteroidales bacterium]|nr:DegV family EDD domain-containing protein [Bacteroidales bacterium]
MNINTKELDGKRFYYSFLAGAQRIFAHQKLLNKINVFPVADADTGTNLASTMRSIIDTSIPTDNLKQTAIAIADAALTGARGNSGIIFAQFLYGFSNEIENEKNINVNSFANILQKSVDYAYEAIANPVEGTMITVMKDWAEYIYTLKDKIDDFNNLIISSLHKAKESLLETPKKLEILAKANVVDAGAKGFVVFLEGMIDFFKHGELKKIVTARNVVKIKDIDAISHVEDDVITYRYCTEALILFEKSNKDNKTDLINAIKDFGDSLVVAGSPKKLRVHIHTDKPAELFSVIKDFGNITYKKVDDMVMQNQIVHHRKWNIALLSDSTSDLPQDLIEKYQIHIVPLSVHFGRDFYLDSVTIKPEQFYNLLKKSKDYPSTAQPTYNDFTNKYTYLSTHYDSIIGIHISKKMSGTWSNSNKAAYAVKERQNNKISVLSSNRLSGALGLMVIRAAKCIENGDSHDKIVNNIDTWISKTKLLASSKTIKYMVKSGRVNPMKGFIANLLNLKPIVTVNDEGSTELCGKPFSEKQSRNLVIKEAENFIKNNQVWGYCISHADNL